MEILNNQALMKIQTPPWLIYKVLPGYGVALLYGAPESGKSFIAIDWALCVASGKQWRGFPTRKGHVLYIASEGGEGIRKRVAAWMDAYNITDVPNIQWLLDTMDFKDEDKVAELVVELEQRYTPKRVHTGRGQFDHTGGLALELIVVDTLARNFGAEDENSFEAMQPFINALQGLANGTGATILLVHHTNAVGTRERGHSSLRGAVNVSYSTACTRDESNRITEVFLQNDKQKDDPRHKQLVFQPRVYPLPMLPADEYGEVSSTLLLESREGKGIPIVKEIAALVGRARKQPVPFEDIFTQLSYEERDVRRGLRVACAEGVLEVASVGPHGKKYYRAVRPQ